MNVFFTFIESLKRTYFRKKNLILILATIIVGVLALVILSFPEQVSACHEPPTQCEPDPENDLAGNIIDGTGIANATNSSELCSHDVGLAVYKKFDENIDNQELFDSDLAEIGPDSTVVLEVELPDCAYQIDLFHGELIESFAGGVRYGDRKLDWEHNNSGGYCESEPEPYCGDGILDSGEECEVGQESCPCGYACNLETCLCEEEPPEPYCGDGNLDQGEECDDGNAEDGDGCSAECAIETPEPYCGDGILDSGEECEVGYECSEGYTCNLQACLCEEEPECVPEDTRPCSTGLSGICEPGTQTCESEGSWGECVQNEEPIAEICNNQLDDNCDGYTDCDDESCSTDPFCEGPPPQPICGNGIPEAGEECDDGNTEDGDGCSANCTVEIPTECTPEETRPCDTGGMGICSEGTQTCDLEGFWSDCVQDEEPSPEICNNGLDDNCDGDIDCNDEGCMAEPVCQPGPEPECEPQSQRPCDTGQLGICAAGLQTCDQDGYWDECVQINQPFAEVCNDGLDNDCDGLADCDDIDCVEDPYCEPVPEPYCGDGNLDQGEECDEGGNNGIECVPPYGSPCNYCSSECEIIEYQDYAFCGDGVFDEPQEECDDGNNENDDGCSTTCLTEELEPECEPGAEKLCDTGNLGICASGTQTCDLDGFWDECIQDEEPIAEICNDGLDNDCNGDADCEDGSCEEHPYCEEEPGPPSCTPEDTRPCGTGQAGICVSGTQTCNSQGFWGACVQNEQPGIEICHNGLDDDCDGSADCGDSDCVASGYCYYITPPGPICTDADGDGYYPYNEPYYCFAGDDCNDSNPNINPGATEICTDGIDNDCDGDIDCDDSDCSDNPLCGHGGPVCTDLDLDGYAIEGGGCGPVDCDDGETNINPGATEICTDDIDNDCDGSVDCADIDCSVQPICGGQGGPVCTDLDLDGYYIEGGDCGLVDCNDDQATINPGATEACNDGLDNDCDALADCADIDCAGESMCGAGPVPECNPGDQRLCDTGLTGICADGSQACGENSQWADCESIDQPIIESCDNDLDDDCNGFTDCEDANCDGVFPCTGGEITEEEEEGWVKIITAQVGNVFGGLLASVGDIVNRFFGTEGNICFPRCFSWWIVLILALYSLIKGISLWEKEKRKARAWFVWTFIIIVAAIFTRPCLNTWLFIGLVLITLLMRRYFSKKKETEEF